YLLGIARATKELLGGAVVFIQLELRDIDPLRLLAIELEELGAAGGRTDEAAEVHLELPSFQLLDRILERGQPVVSAKPHRIQVPFGQRLDFARYRAGAQGDHQRQRLPVWRRAVAIDALGI